jgi:serine-type D-Ala-D-Ala carboxypeptidase/endopeptidase (penicillin-binding protein 4)
VLSVVTAVVLVLALLGRIPGGGSSAQASADQSSSASASGSTSGPPPVGPVLVPVGDQGPVPTRAGLARALDPLLGAATLGHHVGVAVVDVTTGRLLFGLSAADGFAPASTTKLLTAAAALSALGPDRRIATTVEAGARPGQVVLVGGGDPTLATVPPHGFVPAPASLPQLAVATAASLRARGTTTVSLGYDSSLFAAPAVAPTWPARYVSSGEVAPTTALSVDEGRVGPIVEGSGPRVSDPALSAAKAFARQLASAGITVRGVPEPVHAPPPTGPASASAAASAAGSSALRGSSGSSTAPIPAAPGTVLAAVQSPTVADMVGWMLSTSDNDLAESLAHLVAVQAGQPATFAGAAAAVTDEVAAMGVPTGGVRLYDGSGLTATTLVAPVVLGQVLALAASPAHPQLRPLATGLAVAGFSGSLAPPRFSEPGAGVGAGVVRAKTGTLTGVSAIAGTVDDANGRVLAFVVLADEVPPTGALAARAALDRAAAAVAGCGCR